LDDEISDELSKHDATRDEIIVQLRQNLSRTQKQLRDTNLTPLELERLMRLHTNISQVLNTVLRDTQLRDWEKRMRYLEKYGLPPSDADMNSEP
jgi:cytidylate kinase